MNDRFLLPALPSPVVIRPPAGGADAAVRTARRRRRRRYAVASGLLTIAATIALVRPVPAGQVLQPRPAAPVPLSPAESGEPAEPESGHPGVGGADGVTGAGTTARSGNPPGPGRRPEGRATRPPATARPAPDPAGVTLARTTTTDSVTGGCVVDSGAASRGWCLRYVDQGTVGPDAPVRLVVEVCRMAGQGGATLTFDGAEIALTIWRDADGNGAPDTGPPTWQWEGRPGGPASHQVGVPEGRCARWMATRPPLPSGSYLVAVTILVTPSSEGVRVIRRTPRPPRR